MSVSGFIKENRVLVAGLVLPLLLIGILAFAKTLPATMIDPPTHKVAYYSAGWSPKGQLTLKIDDAGHLQSAFKATENYKANTNDTAPKATLYIYDPKTNTTQDTQLTLGDKDALPSLEKFSGLKFSNQQTSPDGYIFESYHYRNHSLITEIFSYHSYNNGPVLSKNNRIVKLPLPNPYTGNTEFLGWLTEEGTK
jgi:hypothetical protein